MLREAAARRWGVAKEECRAERGAIVHEATGRKLGYGELTGAAAGLPVPEDPPLKGPGQFRFIGQPLPRVDAPDIVRGKARYGLDVRVPGQLFAAVARCPVFGGKLGSFDDSQARKVPGVREVVHVQGTGAPAFVADGVAVVADSTFAAFEGRRKLQVSWDPGRGVYDNVPRILEECRAKVAAPAPLVREEGDALPVLATAERRIVAEYWVPFLAHATMEPGNATAQVKGSRCEVWAPTQFPQWAQEAIAGVLQIPPANVTVHVTLLGGGFGRRINPDVSVEAALVAQNLTGRPVQVVWSRDDDLQHDFYRPASLLRLEAALGADGLPTAWLWRIAGTPIRTFYDGPETAEPWRQEMAGVAVFPYRVPNYRVEYAKVDTLVPRGWWRSVDSTQNAFARESFLDELAAAAGKDPYRFRLELLGEPRRLPLPGDRGFVHDTGRLRGVLETAAEKAGWGTALPPGRGRGIAAFFDHLSYCAEVAEVSVEGGEVRVHRVVAAIDCGQVVNPRMVEAQVQGAVVDGLTPTLLAEITLNNGRVRESNFHEYPLLPIGRAPEVEVAIVPSSEPPTGVGEPGLPPIAPAVANALFAATGKRVRKLPITAKALAG
jgi:isoquinoline 1-oxidoreductase beta subunit